VLEQLAGEGPAHERASGTALNAVPDVASGGALLFITTPPRRRERWSAADLRDHNPTATRKAVERRRARALGLEQRNDALEPPKRLRDTARAPFVGFLAKPACQFTQALRGHKTRER
jgi:hypothetical protein